MRYATQTPSDFGLANVNQSPLPSPRRLICRDKPRKRAIALHKPPLCDRCIERTERRRRYESQQQVGKTFPGSLNTGRTHLPGPHGISDGGQSSPGAIQPPCDTLPQASPSTDRKAPGWMLLLPSNINADVRPPRHSVLERRLSFPYFEHTRYSTPFSTPPEFRKGSDMQAAELAKALQELTQQSRSHGPHKTVPNSLQREYYAGAPYRKVKFNLPPLSSTIEIPTPGLTQSPATPVSAPAGIHHLQSHGHWTPDTAAPINDSPSYAINSTPLDQRNALTRPKQMTILQPRLRKPVDYQNDSLGGSYRPASSPRSNDASSPVKPAFLRELSSFLASRKGKYVLPSRIN